MDATEIKTRHGLILQGIVALALDSAGYTFRENWQYDADNERPDFTIPDSDKPRFMVEVHQTDARDSFRMKILRSFTAVCEAKCFFGSSIHTVNVLFGEPATEVPESNVKALCGFFDVNIIPRETSCNEESILIELDSLKLAQDEDYDVASAVAELESKRSDEIEVLGKMLKEQLDAASISSKLKSLWTSEITRMGSLGDPPTITDATHYKKALLQSLFLSDSHFHELFKNKDPNKLSGEAKEQLMAVKLIEYVPSIREAKFGPQYKLDPILHKFLANPDAERLRKYCEEKIDEEPAMKFFFDDIREPLRRKKMCNAFLSLPITSPPKLSDSIMENISSDNYLGIPHRRCWVVDLAALFLGVSHNEMNRQLIAANCDPQGLGNPYNQLSYKSERFLSDSTTHKEYADGVAIIFSSLRASRTKHLAKSADELSARLLELRMGAAVKLQKLNPLYLEVESTCRDLGISCEYGGNPSLLSDLSGRADPVGKYDLFKLTKDGKEVLLNSLYVGEGYGSDHKADEWSARRRSLGYSLSGTTITPSSRAGYVMVLDGVWGEKSVRKLHAAGWTHICQPPQLKETLKACFGLK